MAVDSITNKLLGVSVNGICTRYGDQTTRTVANQYLRIISALFFNQVYNTKYLEHKSILMFKKNKKEKNLSFGSIIHSLI